MKNKVIKGMVAFLVISLLIIIHMPINSFAEPFDPSSLKDATKPDMSGGVANAGGKIIYIIQYVGYTIAILVLLIIGIQYMISSPNEKADIKSRLIPYAIGAIILFGGVSIVSLVYDVVTTAT